MHTSVQWPAVARLHSQLRRNIQAQLAAVMLLLAGLFAVAWALSIVGAGLVTRKVHARTMNELTAVEATVVIVERGRVLLSHELAAPDVDWRTRVATWEARRLDTTTMSVRSFDAPAWAFLLGIDWRWKTTVTPMAARSYIQQERALSIPFWFLILITGASGYLLGRQNWLIRRRVINGQCPACGYDCRATPDRCPECGYRDAEDANDDRNNLGLAIPAR